MRLGSYDCKLKESSRAHKAYKKDEISERHRHRFEFNNKYREQLEKERLLISGINPEKKLVEIVEIESHPWFVGVQFHPEFQSRPVRPAPAFQGFCLSCAKKPPRKRKENSMNEKIVKLKNASIRFSNSLPLVLVAGPCVIEKKLR